MIANSWEPQQGSISVADALDLLLSYLKEEDVLEGTAPSAIIEYGMKSSSTSTKLEDPIRGTYSL